LPLGELEHLLHLAGIQLHIDIIVILERLTGLRRIGSPGLSVNDDLLRHVPPPDVGIGSRITQCPSTNRQIGSRSRRAENLTASLWLIFRGLNFSRNTDIGPIGHLWTGTT
jgi:hypothetical protein